MKNLNLNSLFSGAATSQRTNSVAPRVTMKDGIGQLTSVEPYTSNKGSKCVKLTFGDFSDLENAEKGHVEYLSLSDGARFGRVFDKLAYISQHSTNEAAKQAFATLPSPVRVLTDGVDDAGNPKAIVFKTNEELKAIREAHGEDTTFVWVGDEDKNRVAIKFNNPEEYIAKYINVMKQFIGGNYMLALGQDDRGFQTLKSINPCKL